MTSLPLRIGYGPPGTLEHHTAVARGVMAWALGIPIGVVLGVPETLALDTGRTLGSWYALLVVSAGAGLLIGMLVTRASANLGARVGPQLSVLALIASGAWLALLGIGEPYAVEALVAVAVAATVAPAALGGLDALDVQPDADPLAAVGHSGASLLAGVAVGAGVMFLDPTIVWSDLTGAAGATAVIAAAIRLVDPDRVLGGPPAPPTAPRDREQPAPRLLLAATLGVAAAPVVRIAPWLEEDWSAGVRYALLSLVLAGVFGVAGIVGMLWLPAKARRVAPVDTDDVGRGALLVAGVVALLAISETLPGAVAGSALAAGLAAVGVTVLAAAAARNDRAEPLGPVGTVLLVAAAAWVLGWWTWLPVVSSAGSERVALAIYALPALLAGIVVVTRPRVTEPVVEETTAALPLVTPSTNGHKPRRRPLLEATGIEFSYGSVQVLFGVDLHVDEGEVVALLGTNGAGKTTFLRTVAGLAEPSAGHLRLAGGDLAPFSASDRVLLGINQIAAGGAVAPDLSVDENLAMFGHTLKAGEAKEGARRALEVFPRLAERRSQRASSLSGGERQMLALSKSLVLRPQLLIIDECTLGLAPVAVAALVPVIRKLHEDGSSVLMVEQSVHLALDLADRAVCMEKGRIVHEDDARSLSQDPALLEAIYLEGIAAALEHRDAGVS